jgi:hypothetical protein
MSLGRRIVQKATTRAFRRGIRVIVRKADENEAKPDTNTNEAKPREAQPAGQPGDTVITP